MAETMEESAWRDIAERLRRDVIDRSCYDLYGVPFEGVRELAASDLGEVITAIAAGDSKRATEFAVAAMVKCAALHIGANYIRGTARADGVT